MSRGSRPLEYRTWASAPNVLKAPPRDSNGRPSINTTRTAAAPTGTAKRAARKCGACHQTPYYTDNNMHDLQVERFYTAQLINGELAGADGPIKTFPLRGIKDSPPYLHDGRLLTLDDTVEFFNVVLGLKLTANEKSDLVAFMRAL